MSLESNGLAVLRYLHSFGVLHSATDAEVLEGASLSGDEYAEVVSVYREEKNYIGGQADCAFITDEGIKYLDTVPAYAITHLELARLHDKVNKLHKQIQDFDRKNAKLAITIACVAIMTIVAQVAVFIWLK